MKFNLQLFGGSTTNTQSYNPSDEQRALWGLQLDSARARQPIEKYLMNAGAYALGDTVNQMMNAYNSTTRNNANTFPTFSQWMSTYGSDSANNSAANTANTNKYDLNDNYVQNMAAKFGYGTRKFMDAMDNHEADLQRIKDNGWYLRG